jgi:hypothetical protein
MTLPDGRFRIIHVEAEPEFDEHGHCCAYTGIVAAMHLGGMTAHRLFGLPITSTAGETAGSSISRGSEKGQLLAAGSAIIVDEAFMLRCDCGRVSLSVLAPPTD